jgi:hypothetical protein
MALAYSSELSKILCVFAKRPNELRIDAAEGSKAEEGFRAPPHQSELD